MSDPLAHPADARPDCLRCGHPAELHVDPTVLPTVGGLQCVAQHPYDVAGCSCTGYLAAVRPTAAEISAAEAVLARRAQQLSDPPGALDVAAADAVLFRAAMLPSRASTSDAETADVSPVAGGDVPSPTTWSPVLGPKCAVCGEAAVHAPGCLFAPVAVASRTAPTRAPAFACLLCPDAPEFPSLEALSDHFEATHAGGPATIADVGGPTDGAPPADGEAPGGLGAPAALLDPLAPETPEGLIRNALQALAGHWSYEGRILPPGITPEDVGGIAGLVNAALTALAAAGDEVGVASARADLMDGLALLAKVAELGEALHMLRYRLNEAVRALTATR